MDWAKLVKLIPVAAGMVNPGLEAAADIIITEVDKHIDAQVDATGKSRDEIIAEAGAAWDKNISDADALLKAGHSVGNPEA